MLKVLVRQREVEQFLAKHNLSQGAFAARLGVSDGYMSQLLRGTRYPSAKLRARMLRSLRKATFDDIFEIVDDDELKLVTSRQTKEQ